MVFCMKSSDFSIAPYKAPEALKRRKFTSLASKASKLLKTHDALNQHNRRVYIQAQVWSTSHLAIIPEENPSD